MDDEVKIEGNVKPGISDEKSNVQGVNNTNVTSNVSEEEINQVKEQTNVAKKEKAETGDKKLVTFKYVVKSGNGETLKGFFDARTIDDVKIFLTNNKYEIISITPLKGYMKSISFGKPKISNDNLAFMLTQLSTDIKAGIPLIDSVRILSRQSNKKDEKSILDRVVFELVMGQKFSVALERQGGAFPRLLINMVKTAEMTGDLAGTLDEMADYYTKTERTRKQMKSALIYPAVILILAIAALVFIMVAVVPSFVNMFKENGASLPWITKVVIGISNFFTKRWIILAIVLAVLLIVYRWLFKNIKSFRKVMQTILYNVFTEHRAFLFRHFRQARKPL